MQCWLLVMPSRRKITHFFIYWPDYFDSTCNIWHIISANIERLIENGQFISNTYIPSGCRLRFLQEQQKIWCCMRDLTCYECTYLPVVGEILNYHFANFGDVVDRSCMTEVKNIINSNGNSCRKFSSRFLRWLKSWLKIEFQLRWVLISFSFWLRCSFIFVYFFHAVSWSSVFRMRINWTVTK